MLFLNLRSLVKLYKQLLDCPHIIYSVAEIKKPGYKEVNIFVLSIRGLNVISKTMLFIDSINKEMALTEYLYIKLPNNLKDKIDLVI